MFAAELAFFRAEAESLMGEAVTITRNTGGPGDDALDPNTGQLIPGPPGSVYVGVCRITQQRIRQSIGEMTPAEAAAVSGVYNLRLPLSGLTVEPEAGDSVMCTGSLHDPGLPGRPFTITRVTRSGYAWVRVCEMETSWDAL